MSGESCLLLWCYQGCKLLSNKDNRRRKRSSGTKVDIMWRGSGRPGVYNSKSLLGFCAHQNFDYPNSCKFSTDIRMGATSAHVSRCNNDYSPAVLSFLVDRFTLHYPGFCPGLEKGVQRYGKDIQKFSGNNCSYGVC